MVILHRSSFVDWKPSPVVSLACSGDGSLSAALRENGDLELYETSTLHQFKVLETALTRHRRPDVIACKQIPFCILGSQFHRPVMLQRVPGHVDAAPTSVAIVEESEDAACRIFTAGLDGSIVEVDVENGRPSAAEDSYGGAVWQLAVQPRKVPGGEHVKPNDELPRDAGGAGGAESDSDDEDVAGLGNGSAAAAALASTSPCLAAACDDGCVRIFTVEMGVPGAAYAKSLPRVEGRTLAVAWHPKGEVVVSGGGDGCVRAWHVASGRELLRITVGDGSGREVCVWSLLVLQDGTIVSGDSGGSVCFWDGQNGTLVARFTQHAADVLQLAASPDGTTVFAAGVDPKVAVFQRLKAQGGGKQGWAYLSAKRPHTHDVRAMCVASGKHAGDAPRLLTGGNDTVLMAHSVPRFLKEHPTRVNPCPQRPIIHVARCPGTAAEESSAEGASGAPAPWILSASSNTADIWQLSRPGPSGHGCMEGDGVLPQGMPMHLARLVNKGGNHIAAAAISADGRHVAFSDAYRLRCFQLTAEDASGDSGVQGAVPHIRLAPVDVPSDLPPATHLAFVAQTGNLVSAAADGTVRVLQFPSGSANGGGASEGVTVQSTIRDVHDLRYKLWYRRDRARSAARRLAPAIDLLTLSPDGQWMVASVRGRVQVVSVTTHRIVAQLPPLGEHATLAALGCTPDSSAVAVVTTTNQVASYQLPGGQPTEWTQRNAGSLPRRVLTLPGPVTGVACSPSGPGSVLLFSQEAVCHVDFNAPVTPELPSSKRKREKKSAATQTATPEGENLRALYCSDPVLHVEAVGPREVLVVERPWTEVWKSLAPPMYRHRYGT